VIKQKEEEEAKIQKIISENQYMEVPTKMVSFGTGNTQQS
jgi:hypothetical protein